MNCEKHTAAAAIRRMVLGGGGGVQQGCSLGGTAVPVGLLDSPTHMISRVFCDLPNYVGLENI